MWKKIEGYEDYEISDKGEIRSCKYKRTRLLKPSNRGCSSDYLVVPLCKNGNIKLHYIHRLVAKAFIPNPLDKPQVNHKNGIKTDNNVSNLEWVTVRENTLHAYKNKLIIPPCSFKGKFGKDHCRSIAYVFLNPSGEKEIFYSAYECKRKTGIRNMTLSDIRKKHKNDLPYTLKQGKMKGYTLLSFFNPYKPNK